MPLSVATLTLRQRLAELWPLLLGAAIVLTLWGLHPHPYDASDPWLYARNAQRIREGTFLTDIRSHPMAHRVGLTVPVALMYGLLGLSRHSTVVVPLISALLVVWAVWRILPDRRSKLFGVLIAATSVPLLSFSVQLFPDLTAAALMTLCAFPLWQRRHLVRGGHCQAYGALAAALWFLAFLAKETACWTLLLYGICLLRDGRAGRRDLLMRFYLPSAACGLLLGAAYLCACQLVFGDALARFHSIESLVDVHSWSHHRPGLPWGRLLVGPFRFFTQEFGAVCLLALLSLFFLPRRLTFWAGATTLYVLALWFGSVSMTKYQPLPLMTRMALPCAPGLYVCAGWLLGRLSRLPSRLPHAHSLASPALALLVWLLVTFYPLRQYVRSWQPDLEGQAMALVASEVAAHPERHHALITADARSAEFLSIFWDFKPPHNLAIAPFSQRKRQRQGAETTFFFVHAQRANWLHETYGTVNHVAEVRSADHARVFVRDGIELYRVDTSRVRSTRP